MSGGSSRLVQVGRTLDLGWAGAGCCGRRSVLFFWGGCLFEQLGLQSSPEGEQAVCVRADIGG